MDTNMGVLGSWAIAFVGSFSETPEHESLPSIVAHPKLRRPHGEGSMKLNFDGRA